MQINDERVLILAPTGQDAMLICEQLETVGLNGHSCRNLYEMAASVLEGAATGLIAEESLIAGGVQHLIEALNAQPAWSDLPLTVLTSNDLYSNPRSNELVRKLADAGNVTMLERPLRVMTLLMTVQAAVRVRRRQYEFREYLQQYEQYQEQVRQTQKLESLGVLAGGIAHDFNNLLTGILGNASLAADILPAGHPAHRLVHDVITSSERAAGLTNQMLAYAGKGHFIVRPVNLSSVVRKLTDFFRASVPKRVELELELAPDLPPVSADTSQLEQVVMNLVMNAAEAIPEGRTGRVVVRTSLEELDEKAAAARFNRSAPPPGRYAILQVFDNGAGMDEQTLAKIFDPFFTTKFLGRGLGLAAVQGIIRGHKGYLLVKSKPGEGTAFTILFPTAHTSSQAQAVFPRDREKKGVTVLVVDDEEIIRSTVTSMLEQQGFSVLAAENGKAAVELYANLGDQIEVVLLDISMPVMDGEVTLRELKAIRPKVRVILSSGHNEADAVRRFTGAGVAGFLQKPYTATRLIEKIRRTLESAETTQLNRA